jgi:hypothetical protein
MFVDIIFTLKPIYEEKLTSYYTECLIKPSV